MTERKVAATLVRLMSPELPQFVDLSELADANQTLNGLVRVETMARLRNSVARAERPVEVRIAFFRDDTGTVHLRGDCGTKVDMLCQRCLSPMGIDLHSEVGVAVVRDEAEIRKLRVDVEPLLHPDGKLNLVEFVEEEMLLTLPLAPMHPSPRCAKPRSPEADKRHGRQKPFAGLKDLLK